MRTLAFTTALILITLPAMAGGFSFDLPTLTWPTTVTISTQDCETTQTPCK